ncbi:MAG: hypothetical protein ACP5N2_01845 [Candidatus Nanoarchaeia archaeon]
MSTLIERIFGNRKKKNPTKIQFINFDECTLENKIIFCENAIEGSDFSQIEKEDLKYCLRETTEAENPSNFYYYFENEYKKEVPKNIQRMFNTIYYEVVPTKGKEKALNLFMQGYEELTRNKPPSYLAFHSNTHESLDSISHAFNYLIESNSQNSQELYVQAGDWFFDTALKLKETSNIEDSKHSLALAIRFYKIGNVIIPSRLNKNWKNYAYTKTIKLRTDWQTKKEDLTSIISKYI